MRKANMVDVNKEYIREKVKAGNYKYVDLARVLGKPSKGSLTCAISCERMNLDDLKELARIVNFPYEKALKNSKPKAYIKPNPNNNIREKLDQIVNMQKEINIALIKILEEL